MPSGVGGRREAHDEQADIRTRLPSPAPDQLVERVVQDGGIGGGRKDSGCVPSLSLIGPIRTTGRVQVPRS
jgi:hypothetical protein